MQISAVIPTYNREKLLPKAIDSVLQQTVEVAEIIVIDDGSTDHTKSLIKQKYPQVKYIYQSNSGVSKARNTGINGANSDWIALLDSDDEWLPEKLEQQINSINESELKVCHTNEIWIRDGKHLNQMKKHQKSGGWIFKNCLPLCAMSPSSIVIHRSVFEEAGLFDENLPACEDYDLWLQITARFPVAYVETPQLKKYGGHDDQLSRKYWGMDRFRVIALDKILSQRFLNQEYHQAALDMLLSKLTILKNGAIKRDNQQLLTFCEEKLDRWSA